MRLTPKELAEIKARVARNGDAPASDVDDLSDAVERLLSEVQRLHKVCATAAGDLVRECRQKNVDTMWHGPGCTLWEFLNLNGDELEEPVERQEGE